MTAKDDAEAKKIEAELEEWSSGWARAMRRSKAQAEIDEKSTSLLKSQVDVAKSMVPDVSGLKGSATVSGGAPYRARLVADALEGACANIATKTRDLLDGRSIIITSNDDLLQQAVDHASIASEMQALVASAGRALRLRAEFTGETLPEEGSGGDGAGGDGDVGTMMDGIAAGIGVASSIIGAVTSLFTVTRSFESGPQEVDRDTAMLAMLAALRNANHRNVTLERFRLPAADGLVDEYRALQDRLRAASAAASDLTERTEPDDQKARRASARKANDALIEAIVTFLRVASTSVDAGASPLGRALLHEALVGRDGSRTDTCLFYVGKPTADAARDTEERLGKDKIDGFASVSVPYMIAASAGHTIAAGIEHGTASVSITLGSSGSPTFRGPN
ncbi:MULTISPECIES: hypothetical protein [unclassified Agromyces]|uniref:hypothetical protein n=1 Tax=unclassified Agromyces TaxID=2639701 RepID=UPI003014FFCF